MALALWPWGLVCRAFGHQFRRAHKGEDAAKKYCRRCAAQAQVKRRKATSA